MLEDRKDGETRWIQLRIPVTEGARYKVGDLRFEGNALLAFSDDPNGAANALAALVAPALVAPPEGEAATPARRPPPSVNVTMRIDEGPQYFVNRIIFTGNTTTRDKVIRREMRLVEGGVFNTEALKFSVRRLNQLGYFKELKGEVYFIVDGEIRASCDGQEAWVARPGEAISALPILDRKPTLVSATAAGPARVLLVEDEVFNDLMLDNPALPLGIVRFLAGEVRQLLTERNATTVPSYT